MSQNQLPISSNSQPAYSHLLYAFGPEIIKNDAILPNTSFYTDSSDSDSSLLRYDFNWEYFCNELEFE
ncbi:hypothetical protein [Segetibacter koreensis]|uniref:hypothetical protein n=1 Tax=Segetibacter koreensis TaxID=398037 RepID=UPI00146D384D|nr:hypothetical protein [Segetibacter koreensis]